jgi:hypothetical protein
MNLAATVRTTGLNWESLAVIFAGFATIAGFLLTWSEHRSSQNKAEITDAVNRLSDVLQAKLETKQVVSGISERLARLEGSISASGTTNIHNKDG